MPHWWKSEHTSLYGMGWVVIILTQTSKLRESAEESWKLWSNHKQYFPRCTIILSKLQNSILPSPLEFHLKIHLKIFNPFSPCWSSFWQSGTSFWNPDTKDRKLKSDNHFDKIFCRLLQLYIVGSCALLEKQVLCNSIFSKHQLAQYIVYRHILYKMIYVGLSVLSLLITLAMQSNAGTGSEQ